MKAFVLFQLLVIVSATTLCQSEDFSVVREFSTRLIEQANDFSDFISLSTRDTQVAGQLRTVAMNYYARSDFIEEELLIVALLKDPSDKQKIAGLVQSRILGTLKDFESAFTHVNLALSVAKTPAIVAAGNKLKDTLKDLEKQLRVIAHSSLAKQIHSSTSAPVSP
jgi:hypothetical protein